MTDAHAHHQLPRRWIGATWIGWLLGVPCIVALALLGEALGIGGVQLLVGMGMGIGVGAMQSREIRKLLGSGAPWFWSCVGGLSASFLVSDVAVHFGVPYMLPVSVAVGGLLVGVWQAMLLRKRVKRSGSWVLASVVGWVLAAGTVSVADLLVKGQAIRGVPGLISFLAIVAVGGLVLGLVTGFALSRLQPNA